MERKLRIEIIEVVAEAVRQSMSVNTEVWVSGSDLCKQFAQFTPKWLREYGDILPRKRLTVTGLDGKSHSSRWAYPRNEIAQNIRNGLYDDLKVIR